MLAEGDVGTTDAPAGPRSSSASGRAGRADEATFAEALQAVDELQSVSSSAPGMLTSVTDRIEGMLIEELEAADAEAAAEEESHPADVEAGRSEAGATRPDAAGYSRLDRSESVEIFATDWRMFYRRCCANAPSRLWDDCLAFLAIAPLLLVVLFEAGEEPFPRAQLLLLPAYAFAAARVLTLTLEAIASVLLQYRPVFDRVSIMVSGSFGCALPSITLGPLRDVAVTWLIEVGASFLLADVGALTMAAQSSTEISGPHLRSLSSHAGGRRPSSQASCWAPCSRSQVLMRSAGAPSKHFLVSGQPATGCWGRGSAGP